MNIKELFDKGENGTLTYEQFEALAKESEAKFTDLSEGKYVSKSKYDSDIKAKDTQLEGKDAEIANLNTTITTRDTDLADLQKQLADAGNDAEKLAELNNNFTSLQGKYEADILDYQNRMQQQAYEFAVKEFANSKNFSSQAAKRDFIHAMLDRKLQMDGDKILGREDFIESYSAENADAFVVEKKEEPKVEPATPVPTFVQPTQGMGDVEKEKDNFAFNFTGVRAH